MVSTCRRDGRVQQHSCQTNATSKSNTTECLGDTHNRSASRQEPTTGYHAARNRFERCWVFPKLSNRFELECWNGGNFVLPPRWTQDTIGCCGRGFFPVKVVHHAYPLKWAALWRKQLRTCQRSMEAKMRNSLAEKTHERQRNLENLLMDTHNECTTSRDPLTIHHKRRTNHRNSATAL